MAAWILVTGNDAITVLDIEEILEANGYKVTTAAPIVWDRFRQPNGAYDLVLIDLDGRNLSPAIHMVTRLHERSPIRVAVLAAVPDDEIGAHSNALRLGGLLRKPFRDRDLLVMVRRVLSL